VGGGRFALLGGLDAADGSTASVVLADLKAELRRGSLPGPQHDAQAAVLAGKVYVFGGGYLTELDHILSYDPGSDAVGPAGTLPTASSDVAVAASGGSAYVVGGFDGSAWLDTILAWRSGAPARVAARLPVGLRYAAAASVGRVLLILGGSTPSGASRAIYRFDPAAGTVQRIGQLAHPTTHAGAATLDGTVYLVGGRGDNTDAQTAAVWAIDPLTGRVRRAGQLPQPLSDAGVAAVGDAIIVAGGRSPAGTQSAVGELVPAS
jgi:N-acetylneuraminic acid mutarotase